MMPLCIIQSYFHYTHDIYTKMWNLHQYQRMSKINKTWHISSDSGSMLSLQTMLHNAHIYINMVRHVIHIMNK